MLRWLGADHLTFEGVGGMGEFRKKKKKNLRTDFEGNSYTEKNTFHGL